MSMRSFRSPFSSHSFRQRAREDCRWEIAIEMPRTSVPLGTFIFTILQTPQTENFRTAPKRGASAKFEQVNKSIIKTASHTCTRMHATARTHASTCAAN